MRVIGNPTARSPLSQYPNVDLQTPFVKIVQIEADEEWCETGAIYDRQYVAVFETPADGTALLLCAAYLPQLTLELYDVLTAMRVAVMDDLGLPRELLGDVQRDGFGGLHRHMVLARCEGGSKLALFYSSPALQAVVVVDMQATDGGSSVFPLQGMRAGDMPARIRFFPDCIGLMYDGETGVIFVHPADGAHVRLSHRCVHHIQLVSSDVFLGIRAQDGQIVVGNVQDQFVRVRADGTHGQIAQRWPTIDFAVHDAPFERLETDRRASVDDDVIPVVLWSPDASRTNALRVVVALFRISTRQLDQTRVLASRHIMCSSVPVRVYVDGWLMILMSPSRINWYRAEVFDMTSGTRVWTMEFRATTTTVLSGSSIVLHTSVSDISGAQLTVVRHADFFHTDGE